jgi:hypothetical protein
MMVMARGKPDIAAAEGFRSLVGQEGDAPKLIFSAGRRKIIDQGLHLNGGFMALVQRKKKAGKPLHDMRT